MLRLSGAFNRHVPAYGAIRMIAPSAIQDDPRQDYVLNGILEIFVPQPLGRLRCRSTRIGFRSIYTFRLRAGGIEEIDKLNDTEADLREHDNYTWLEVGTQRYD